MAKTLQLAVLVAIASVAWADSSILEDPPVPYNPAPYSRPAYPPYPHVEYKEKAIPYSFSYGIKDEYVGADFGQEEQSDGDLVKGSYYVALPDGRLQTVKYQADHVVGYVADVEYKGDALHPIPSYNPVPVYPRAYAPLPLEDEAPASTEAPYDVEAEDA